MNDPISHRPSRANMSDHDLLTRIDERTGTLGTSYIELAKVIATLDQRVKVLESWKDNLTGKLAIVVAVVTFLVQFVGRYLDRLGS